jgi:DNA mismatch repair protein MutS2
VDEITFDALEFSSVIAELSNFAVTEPGVELALRLSPTVDIDAVAADYSELKEASLLLEQGLALPLGGISILTSLLKKLEMTGAYLTTGELLTMGETLGALGALRAFTAEPLYVAQQLKLPIITNRLDSISTPAALKESIDRKIDGAGEIRDDASFELSEIRRTLRDSKQNCRNIVDRLLRDSDLDDALREDYFTIRDDRFVVCVKSSYHTQIPGVVHGRSASGETYFIEPLGTVEINNRVSILKQEEREEEILILKAISSELFAERIVIESDVECAAVLDLAVARARFKKKIDGVIPVLKLGGEVRLIDARHPILVLGKGKGSSVVPVDILLGANKRALVISGANTGGKTVALKTLGLFVLMAQAALPLPVAQESELPFYKGLYVDIGDRQDINKELSTFSAHLKRVAEILKKAGSDTLVLLDEIGVGTDPAEGGALALSIIETLAQQGATIVVTTHLNLLKAHAATNDCFENASVLFDDRTSSPLYKLRYGMPGASMALVVAQEYGIPRDVVERARRSLTGGEGAFVESLRKIDEEKRRLENLNASLLEKEARKAAALKRLRDDRQVLLKNARAKIDGIIAKARTDIRAHAEAVKAERAGAAGEVVSSRRGNVKAAMAQMEQAGQRIVDTFKERAAPYEPQIGDTVKVAGSNARGSVVAVEGKRVELLMGNLKVWVALEGIEKAVGGVKAVRASRRASRPAKAVEQEYRTDASLAINIVGLRVDEALPKLERAIDDAHMAGGASLDIIHGSGGGVLRAAVREYLKTCPVVKGFKGGDPLAGGEGVTIAELI